MTEARHHLHHPGLGHDIPSERGKGFTMAGRAGTLLGRDDGGRTAISLGLTDPDRVADLVEQGAWVAIFVSEDPEPHLAHGSTRKLPPLTRILLPKVQVLEVGEPTAGSEVAQRASRVVLTVAVTHAEAEKVICGARNGDLTFALRSDRGQAVTRPVASNPGIAPQLYGSAS